MIWRKKRAGEGEVEGRALSTLGAGPEVSTAGARTAPATDGGVRVSTAEGVLNPQNGDTLSGSLAGGAREFQIPVRNQGAERPYTVPRNYRITGDITSARRVVVCGEFAGGVLDAPTVTVAAGGVLRGQVKTVNLQVAGAVEAEVRVQDALEVSSRGRVSGRVYAPQVKVWPGAALHGTSLSIGTSPTAPRG